MSILNIITKTKLIAVKGADILPVKKIATQAHNIQMICLVLLFSFFSIESEAKDNFDVTFKSHNSELNANLGVVTMDDNAEISTSAYFVSKASNLVSKASNQVSKASNQVSLAPKQVSLAPKQVSLAPKQVNSVQSEERMSIVYANGMFTSPSEAAANLVNITRKFYHMVPTANIKLAFNQSEDVLNQVAEVAAQHLKQKHNLTERQAWLQMAYKFLLPSIYNFLEDAETEVSSWDEDNYVNDVDLNYLVNQHVLPPLQAGHRLVVLAHSQGNFYANRAWNTIANMTNGSELTKALGIVGVANVASYTAGNGLHTTNSNDHIVNAVRILPGKQPRPANITHPFTLKDPMGHGLSEIYLNDDLDAKHIKKKIIADVSTTFSRLAEAATCNSLNHASNTHADLTYNPGENYTGNLNYYMNSSVDKYNLIIKNQYDATIYSLDYFTGQKSGSFYYNGSSDGILKINIRWLDGYNPNYINMVLSIDCP